MTRARKIALLIGVGASLAVLAAVAVASWLFLAPEPQPGQEAIHRLGCDSLSSVSVFPHRADATSPATSLDCRIAESLTPPTCAAVLAAYEGAPGHREGNVLVEVNGAKTIGGKRTFVPLCKQVLAPDGTVVDSYR